MHWHRRQTPKEITSSTYANVTIDKWDVMKNASVKQWTLEIGQNGSLQNGKSFNNPTSNSGLTSKNYKELKKLDIKKSKNTF